MKLQNAVNDLQASGPNGVLITTDVDALPSYPLRPDLRTPLRRHADGRLELVLLAQPTTNDTNVILSVPDILGINGETQIGLSRANRIMPAGHTSMPVAPTTGTCNICESMPGPNSGHGCRPAFRVDNKRPFGPLAHKVVSSQRHIVSLNEIGVDEVRDATEQFYEIAAQGRKAAGDSIDGLNIGMNFGVYARSGASQTHFHYQVTGLGKSNYNAGDRLGALCQAYRQRNLGADYLGDYLRALHEADLVIIENSELALAYAPISPRFRGEVQIMLCQSQAGNILDTTREEREALADLQCNVMQRYYRLGCQALNQVWFMTRFSTENEYGQRLIISLYPRTSILAFYELSGNHVIDTLPWKSAQTLRAADQLHFGL